MKYCAFALVLSLLIGGCGQEPEAVKASRPVQVIKAALADAKPVWEFPAVISPRHETLLGFRIAGQVQERLVEVGNRVSQGELLARLDDTDLVLQVADVEAQLRGAGSELNNRRADLARLDNLRKARFVSPTDHDRAVNLFTEAQARVESFTARLALLRKQVTYSRLLAQADGVVIAVQAEPGQVVQAGAPLITLAGLETDALFEIPEHYRDNLLIDQEISVELWSRPTPTYLARIREVAPSADAGSRTYRVRATVLAKDQRMALGMSARVRLMATGAAPRIRIPLSALYQKEGKTAVWVLDPQASTVSLREVATGGPDTGGSVAVQGVEAGELVVISGVHDLRDGQKVRQL